MSRIRSIHPGLWTDEEFVTLSAFARLLFMGLWNECDDKGVFEWKPLTLKMRLLPADNVDVAALLDEISDAGCIRRYEVDGKAFGAVRNFGKYQRPKKPNDIHPITAEIRQFCALVSEPVDADPKPVGNQFRTGGEKAPQREEGGGNSSSVSNDTGPTPEKIFWDRAKPYIGGKNPGSVIGKWCRDYGRAETKFAITEAQAANAVDPIPYVERVLRKAKVSEGMPVC